MIVHRLWPAALAASALAPPSVLAAEQDNPSGQSTFVSPGRDVGFAFTVPDNGNTDIFFSLRVPVERSWGAVGLGSDEMAGALFLVIYRNERGDNVTFSPRLAYGNYEPQYFGEVKFEVLNGTGIVDNHMVFVAKCSEHCRSWPASNTNKGYIDVSSATQRAIYALGPTEGFQSSNPAANLKFHEEFGSFTIDFKRTQGSPDAPVLNGNSQSEGTTLVYRTTGKSDYKAAVHAAFMITVFIAAFPAGVVLLRLRNLSKWHALNQTVSLVGALIGFGFGVAASLNYQRSRSFRSSHQILGLIIMALVMIQLTLGVLHHFDAGKAHGATTYRTVHLWLGRTILVLGVLNAFFGFTFALDRKYGMVLAGLLFFGACVALFILFGQRCFFKKKRHPASNGPLSGANTGYQPQPWRNDGYQQPGGTPPLHDPPPGYEPPSQQIGLQPVSSAALSRRASAERKNSEQDLGLGNVQRPREFA